MIFLIIFLFFLSLYSLINLYNFLILYLYRLMYFNLRVSCWDSIDLTVDLLLFEDGSLPNSYCKFGVSIALVRRYEFFSELVLFYHEFEVYVDILARCHVISLFLLFLFFGLFNLDSPLFSFELDLLNGFHKGFIFFYFVI